MTIFQKFVFSIAVAMCALAISKGYTLGAVW